MGRRRLVHLTHKAREPFSVDTAGKGCNGTWAGFGVNDIFDAAFNRGHPDGRLYRSVGPHMGCANAQHGSVSLGSRDPRNDAPKRAERVVCRRRERGQSEAVLAESMLRDMRRAPDLQVLGHWRRDFRAQATEKICTVVGWRRVVLIDLTHKTSKPDESGPLKVPVLHTWSPTPGHTRPSAGAGYIKGRRRCSITVVPGRGWFARRSFGSR